MPFPGWRCSALLAEPALPWEAGVGLFKALSFSPCPWCCVSLGDAAGSLPDTSGSERVREAVGSSGEQSRLRDRGMRGAARDFSHQ